MEAENTYDIRFDNYWQRDASDVRAEVLEVWQRYGGPTGDGAEERLRQLVYVVRNGEGRVVGISTAFKFFFKQLRHHFYAVRLLLAEGSRVPGLTSKLLVMTRDYLETIHHDDTVDQAIGIVTIAENDRIRKYRNEAVWPASGMVYIGDTPKGYPIRVYYFKGARLTHHGAV